RGDVRGKDRGRGGHLDAVQAHAPPLHRGTVRSDSTPGPGDDGGAVQHPRSSSRPRESPAWLPLRRALPLRHRDLSHGRAGAGGARAFAPVCVPPSRGGRRDSGVGRGGTRVTTMPLSTTPTEGLAGKSDAPYLDVRHLVKEFPVTKGAVLLRRIGSVHAVSDITFSVMPGETFGLVGESGCGKTTTGRMIVALEPPTSGSIVIAGEDIATMSSREVRPRRRHMQMMFQDPYASLDPRMRVATILREPLAIQRIGTRQEQFDRVAELLNDVGLARGAMDRYPHEFSGGQRQRIGLARALALQPKLIVADEPVSALDVSIRSQILNLMNRLQEKYQLTYVIISHDLSVVKYMSDRIGVMYLGKLVEIGSGEDIYARPAHPYPGGLVSATPIPDPDIERSKDSDAPKGEIPSAITPPSGCRYRTRCPRAQSLCAEVEPPLRPFGPQHEAACHYPLRPPSEIAA